MTQPYQPEQPQSQQPFQQQPQQQPFGGPQAYQPPPERTGNTGVAVLVGIVAMLVGAAIYGIAMRVTAEDNGEYTLFSYAAIAVGLLVGLALGKLGGRNSALPFVGAAMAIVGAIVGQYLGYALMISKWSGGEISAIQAITDEFSALNEGFKEDFSAMVAVIYAVGAAAGFGLTKRLGGS